MVRIKRTASGVKQGDEFGRLKVIGPPFIARPASSQVVVQCDCGAVAVYQCEKLARERPSRCKECYLLELRTHKGSRSRLYRIRWGIIGRCTRPNRDRYCDYGGRGIGICAEWLGSFEAFRDWALANGYTDNLQIDRIDNDGDYCPENCRWVTAKQNTRNRNNNRIIKAFGESKCLSDWADDKRCMVGLTTIRARLSSGWSAELAITKPSRNKAAMR